jgi:hypothetical protein
MLSTDLWRWYINITITILNVIHRPAFYLKLILTLYVYPYITGNMLRLSYEPRRLINNELSFTISHLYTYLGWCLGMPDQLHWLQLNPLAQHFTGSTFHYSALFKWEMESGWLSLHSDWMNTESWVLNERQGFQVRLSVWAGLSLLLCVRGPSSLLYSGDRRVKITVPLQ